MYIYSLFFVASVAADVISVPLNNTGVSYIASIGIGSPPTQYNLIVDTGSSNTWIGANKPYTQTNTSQDTGNSVSANYGSGSFTGEEWEDTVTILNGLVINKQSIGVASNVTGISAPDDGILGLGPANLTNGTLTPNTTDVIPTVIDSLFNQKLIDAHEFGISFKPTTAIDIVNGELSLGGVDASKYTGSITYVPITTTSPASDYWGIDATVTYGNTTVLSSNAGIVDTGAALISIATDAFKTYQEATGGVMDSATGLLKITSDQFNSLKSLDFNIGGTIFKLTPNAQIFPRSLNTAINGTADGIYLIISGDGSNNNGPGFGFTLGKPFMERFYTVFDIANKRVGVATTPFTNATTN